MRQSLRLAPGLGLAHRALLRFHADRAEWEQVVSHARAAAALEPSDPRAALWLGRGLQHLGRHVQAEPVLQDLVRREPGLSEGWERLGRSLRALGRPAEARPCLERALPGTKDPRATLRDLAHACLEAGDVPAHLSRCREERRLLAERCTKRADFERWVEIEIALGAACPSPALLGAFRSLPRRPDRDRHLLKVLAWLGPLPEELLALAEPLAAGDTELAWIARVSRLLGAGERASAAAELRGLEAEQRWSRGWSALMAVAHPGHFAAQAPLPARRAAPAPGGDVAAVTCFFDTTGSNQRLRNFRAFQRGLEASGVPLLVVELAFGDRPFRIEGVDDVIQIRDGDLMWQKERLLNLGIERLLERGWQKIAWLDADLVFEAPDWAKRVSRVLDGEPLCQVCCHVHVPFLEHDPGLYLPGSAWLQQTQWRLPALGFAGWGWAARAELLSEIQLYDGAVLGSGDMLMCQASWPEPRPERMAFSYAVTTRWARAWGARVAGRVGFADGFGQALFHGPIAARRYGARAKLLYDHDFSPERDLALSPSGCWRWGSDKPGLHRDVAAYFASRGEAPVASPEGAA